MSFVLGMDVGYSNLCLTFGLAQGHPAERTYPSGAGPEDRLPQAIQQTANLAPSDFFRVHVNDTPWVAGVNPSKLQGWERTLHADYPSTDAYQALFRAALASSGQHTIHHLVTGLPTKQYLDETRRDRLKTMLVGTHTINSGNQVKVEKVTVLPQPAGGYMDYVSRTDNPSLLSEGRVLVLDPGFFSVDWALMEAGELRHASSDSSAQAVSALLDELDNIVEKEYSVRIGIDRLDDALRRDDFNILIKGQRIDVRPYFDKAKNEIAENALRNVAKTMRNESTNIDLILIVGGGAYAYEAATRSVFQNIPVAIPESPVMANARGFWFFGV